MADAKTLNEEIKGLKIFSLNGSNFIGVHKTVEGGIEVSQAFPVATSDFKQVIKGWIKAKNLNQLETFTVEGENNTLVTKGFTEEKLMVIDIVAAQADYAMKYAVANIQNDAIDN